MTREKKGGAFAKITVESICSQNAHQKLWIYTGSHWHDGKFRYNFAVLCQPLQQDE